MGSWKEFQRLWNEFETGGFIAQKRLWNVAEEKMLEDGSALSTESGNQLGTDKAVYEENVLSSWLLEVVEEKVVVKEEKPRS